METALFLFWNHRPFPKLWILHWDIHFFWWIWIFFHLQSIILNLFLPFIWRCQQEWDGSFIPFTVNLCAVLLGIYFPSKYCAASKGSGSLGPSLPLVLLFTTKPCSKLWCVIRSTIYHLPFSIWEVFSDIVSMAFPGIQICSLSMPICTVPTGPSRRMLKFC